MVLYVRILELRHDLSNLIYKVALVGFFIYFFSVFFSVE